MYTSARPTGKPERAMSRIRRSAKNHDFVKRFNHENTKAAKDTKSKVIFGSCSS
jgi:hypothetical protein